MGEVYHYITRVARKRQHVACALGFGERRQVVYPLAVKGFCLQPNEGPLHNPAGSDKNDLYTFLPAIEHETAPEKKALKIRNEWLLFGFAGVRFLFGFLCAPHGALGIGKQRYWSKAAYRKAGDSVHL